MIAQAELRAFACVCGIHATIRITIAPSRFRSAARTAACKSWNREWCFPRFPTELMSTAKKNAQNIVLKTIVYWRTRRSEP